MCGIFGQFSVNGIQDAKNRSAGLLAALAHRGPDDHGVEFFNADGQNIPQKTIPSLILGQTRLSILDISKAGHQPMFSTDGRYCLVYNGEIYNFRELRLQLQKIGYSFRSSSDTEVLLYWLAEYGERRLTELNGMFAFAFYDAKENTLLCVRDFFGIKPFFYYMHNESFCFASEISAIFESGVRRDLNPQSVYAYLFWGQYDVGDQTFYKGVYSLLPGHFFKLDLKKHAVSPEVKCYWRPDPAKRSDVGFKEAADHIRQLFLKNVEMHLISDVPLGIALSGGIDSSAIACAVRYLNPDRELHTFSYVADDPTISEEQYIRLVEEYIHAESHHVSISMGHMRKDLNALVDTQNEPFGSTSIYAQYKIFQCARENGIEVVLEGQGADEMFGGYTGYPECRLRTYLHQGSLTELWHFLNAAPRISGLSRSRLGKNLFFSELPSCVRPYLRNYFKKNMLRDLSATLNLTFFRKGDINFSFVNRIEEMFPGRNFMKQCLAYQMCWHGLPQLLRHGDRNAMAFSVENRVPFLTREMAEFCLSLPEDYLVTKDCLTKSVFREAMRGIVPDVILDRKDKIGFATPEKKMFLSDADWVSRMINSADGIPYFNVSNMKRYWQFVQEGKRSFDWTIWRWINLIMVASQLHS